MKKVKEEKNVVRKIFYLRLNKELQKWKEIIGDEIRTRKKHIEGMTKNKYWGVVKINREMENAEEIKLMNKRRWGNGCLDKNSENKSIQSWQFDFDFSSKLWDGHEWRKRKFFLEWWRSEEINNRLENENNNNTNNDIFNTYPNYHCIPEKLFLGRNLKNVVKTMSWNTKKRVEMRSRGGNDELEHKKEGGNDE